MAKRLILAGLLVLAGCESTEGIDPKTTYFPTGRYNLWSYWSWSYWCENEYFDWIMITVDSVYTIAGVDFYGTQVYREGSYLDQSRIEFYDIGRAWGFKEDSVIGYGFDGRVALPLFPEEGDTFTTAFYRSKSTASYVDDTLYINGIVSWGENENEASFHSWFTKRVIGKGMVSLVDSFYTIIKATNQIAYLKIITWN